MTGMTAATADATTRPARNGRGARGWLHARLPARRAARTALALAALCSALAAGGCGTGAPAPISASELAEAQTFPYYRVYWVGRSFDGHPLAAADGLKNYNDTVGDSVYYGDCVNSKGIVGGGNCLLPLQVTTVMYALHSNTALGSQHNLLVRGVPATVYDEGRAIELYTGRVAIDVFSDTYAHALQASRELLPVNAPGSASADLPLPVYCPGLSGALDGALARTMADLPGHVCQYAAASAAYAKALYG
jgi:hypothetical protein